MKSSPTDTASSSTPKAATNQPEARNPSKNGDSEPRSQINKGNNESNGGKTGKGKGRSTERDSVNALLSLGRDLQAEEAEAAAAAAATNESATEEGSIPTPLAKRPPQPILPDALVGKPSKKRQKKSKGQADANETNTKVDSSGENQGEKKLADFWYWLKDGERVGEWDVLCGRGGESNNFIGNRRFRKMVHSKKSAYREIPVKQRKVKTAFVKSIVDSVITCGGRFVDLDDATGKYYVVTMEKARKKTSQALRETKDLKWLELTDCQPPAAAASKNSVCPYCQKTGHKTKIAKACLKHHEWEAANGVASSSLKTSGSDGTTGSLQGGSHKEQTSEGPRPSSLGKESHAPNTNIITV